MNWMEGSLARQSRKNAKNEELLRQQKYFAQNRTKKYSNNKDSAASLENFVPSYIARAPVPQVPTNEARTASKNTKNKPKPTIRNDNSDFLLLSNTISLSPATNKVGKPSVRTLSVPTTTAIELNAKRQKLLQQQDWAGIITGGMIGFRIETGNYDKDDDEPPPAWNMNKRGRGRAKTNLAPQQSRLKKGSTKISIGSQLYRWSPGQNSVKTKHNSQLSTSHGSSTRSWKRLVCGSRSSPRKLTGISGMTQTAHQQVRVPVSPSSSQTLRLACIDKDDEMGDGCDKPQLVVLSSPQLICHPRPSARASCFNLRRPTYDPCEKSDQADAGESSNFYLDPSETFATWRDQLSSSLPQSPPALESWKDTSQRTAANGRSEETTAIEYPDRFMQGNLDFGHSPASRLNNIRITPASDPELRGYNNELTGRSEKELGDDDAVWEAFIHANDEPMAMLPEYLQRTVNNTMSADAVNPSEDQAPMSTPSDEGPEPGLSIQKENGPADAAPPRCISAEGPVNRDEAASSDQASPCDIIPALPSSTAATVDKGEAVTSGLSNSCLSDNKHFRFHKPKLFVGRLASNGLPAKSASNKEPVAKKRGGRQRKRRRLNHVDIRSVPNFSDDPIEEEG